MGTLSRLMEDGVPEEDEQLTGVQEAKAGHTPGPWETDGLNIFGKSIDKPRQEHIAVVTGLSNFDTVMPRQANARLIAEAGTVSHETGLTPRQLADKLESYKKIGVASSEVTQKLLNEIATLKSQRNELLGNLRNLTLAIESEIDLDDHRFLAKVVAKSRAAIAKAQQEG